MVGNPGRIVKYRYSQAIIDDLMKIKWWNWPYDKVKKNISTLLSMDIEKTQNMLNV